jgi:multidrug efflux pump subunit AcrA (membrane-fusion protein)
VHSVETHDCFEVDVNRYLLTFIGVAVLGAGCASPPEQAERAPAPVAVSIVAAESTALTSSFEAGGVVRARATAAIASRMMAPILEVHVRPGDRVRRDAPLVTLDSREVMANRSRAAATLASAVEAVHAADADAKSAAAAMGLARATHDRIRTLHDKRSATQQELDQAVSALDAAEAQLGSARARMAAATAARDAAQAASDAAAIASSYAVLVAPFDGLVTERSADPGIMATPGLALLTIEDATTFRLEVALDEARASHVALGQNADVRIGDPGSPNHWAGEARISEVARLDPASHSFLVKLDLPSGPSLRSGLFGRARFAGPTRQALVIPASAAVRRGQLTFVYTVNADGRATLQPVSLGAEDRGRIEILAGLREGERVITNPPATLSEGMQVTGGRP